MEGRCLIADADPAVRSDVRHFLEARKWVVLEARSCHEASALFRRTQPEVVLLDERLPGGSVLELLAELQSLAPGVPLVVLAASASRAEAARYLKHGAKLLLPKSMAPPKLLESMERLARPPPRAAPAPVELEALDPFQGSSPLIRQLQTTVRRLLDSDRSVLLLGETGTGKGVLASWLHQHGPRAHEPFVQLNCAGLAPPFLETELFGHERGAFTSAVSRKQGLLELAHRGTVFLDEVGDMDPLVQPKLLKVLEEKRFRRLGEVEERSVDIRLIAATHQDLAERVRQQQFRSDLYFRISTLPLRLPPLRERTEDIVPIAHTLLERLAPELGRPGIGLTTEAESALCAWPWPGNIRELRNVLERAAILSSRATLRVADLDFHGATPGGAPPPDVPTSPAHESDLTLREVERRHIARVLTAEGGNVARAAQRLGIPRSSLYQKLKVLGLSSKV